MKITIAKDVLRKAVEYHAGENKGLTPLIESDADLVDWGRYVIADCAGFDLAGEELAQAGGLAIEIRPVEEGGEPVAVVEGGVAILEAVRTYIL